jgi:hypothetical protein
MPGSKRKGGGGGASRKDAGKRAGGRGRPGELIISKSRTKAASELNVAGDFYGALDDAVRRMIAEAEQRARNNNRRTLRPHDL